MSLLLTADQHALFRSRDDCSTAPKDRDVLCLADISRVTCDHNSRDLSQNFRLHSRFITDQKKKEIENNLLLINVTYA